METAAAMATMESEWYRQARAAIGTKKGPELLQGPGYVGAAVTGSGHPRSQRQRDHGCPKFGTSSARQKGWSDILVLIERVFGRQSSIA